MISDLIQNYRAPENALHDQTILITGASGGLGASLARSISSLGGQLVLLDKNERALNQLHDEIESACGVQPGLYPLDLAGATVDDYHQLADTLKEIFDGLNGVVHCAASLGQITPLASVDAKIWQTTFTVNVHAPMLLTQALLPLLRDTGQASVVFTLDDKCKAYWGSYAVSKAAIAAMMTTLADEFDADRNVENYLPVTCNAIDPGKMRTALRSSAFPGENPDKLPDPSVKVPAYLYLLGNDARDINGQTFNLGDQELVR